MQESKLQKIKTVLGASLLSLVEYHRFQTTITVLIVDQVNFAVLETLRPLLQNENFIIFQEDDLKNGVDVFPLDFLHIKNHYHLIEGKDYFAKIKIKKEYLQRKLEFELRNKLVYLREQYLLTSKTELLKHILPTFVLFLDGLFFLKDLGEKPTLEDNLAEIEKAYKIDLNVLKTLNQKNQPKDTTAIIQKLNDVLIDLNRKVDKIRL